MEDAELAAVVALELRLLDPVVRASPAAVLALLADDFREHGASGRVWTREDVAAAVSEVLEEIAATDVEASWLAEGVALVTYRSHAGGRTALRSSVWVRTDDGWLMRFHQGTPVDPASGAG